jgi:hypothetical protein
MITFTKEQKARQAALILSMEWAAAWVTPMPSGKFSVGYDDAGDLPENVPFKWGYQNGEEVSK